MRGVSRLRRWITCNGKRHTLIGVSARYHDALRASGAHLILAGVGDGVARQLRDTGAVELIGQNNIFGATESVGESLNQALQRAEQLRVGGGDSGNEGPIPRDG